MISHRKNRYSSLEKSIIVQNAMLILDAINAVESMQKCAEESDASEMTLEEINEEIRLAREERKKRLGL